MGFALGFIAGLIIGIAAIGLSAVLQIKKNYNLLNTLEKLAGKTGSIIEPKNPIIGDLEEKSKDNEYKLGDD